MIFAMQTPGGNLEHAGGVRDNGEIIATGRRMVYREKRLTVPA
jgi:hypothetical protein